MIKRLWASIKAFFYTPVPATESQPKENTVKLSLTVVNDSQPADGVSPIYMLAIASDDAGNPLSGTQLYFSAAGATLDFDHVITDGNGRANVTLVSNVACTATLNVSTPDGATSVTGAVSFVAVPPQLATVNISDPATPADATSITATLSPLEAMKEDFDKVVAFIEHGIEVLGKDAEADLVALKNKFIV
ncbi:Ig-like domain-containing protein [Rahnella aceris]